MAKKMTTHDIDTYLAQIGATLEQAGVQEEIEILLVGGAFMLGEGYRRFTEDVDVWPRNVPASSDDDAAHNELTQALVSAANKVARRNRLGRHWFNDDSALFLREYLRPDRHFYQQFGPLVVYKPSKECVLASKIMVGRDKDLDDARAIMADLGITTREQAQAILNRFVPNKLMQIHHKAPQTLRTLFG